MYVFPTTLPLQKATKVLNLIVLIMLGYVPGCVRVHTLSNSPSEQLPRVPKPGRFGSNSSVYPGTSEFCIDPTRVPNSRPTRQSFLNTHHITLHHQGITGDHINMTGGHSKYDLPYTPKPTYSPISTNNIWSYLLWFPVLVSRPYCTQKKTTDSCILTWRSFCPAHCVTPL